ncbi:hypothetical protein BH10ACT8_BH10ACT8_18160 [soil metagenome]
MGRGDALSPSDRIQVLHPPVDVMATVPGPVDTWLVRWTADSRLWSCSCPAKTATCGHIIAVRRIVVLDTEDEPLTEGIPS